MSSFRSRTAAVALTLAAVVGVASAAPPEPASLSHYTVQASDTSWSAIVRKFCPSSTSTAAAAFSLAATGSTNGTVRVGQIIHVSAANCPAVAATTTTVAATTTTVPATTTTVAPTTTTTVPATTTTTTTTVPVTTTTAPPASGVLWSEDFSDATGVDRLFFQVHNMIGTPNVPDGAEGGNSPLDYHGDHDMACGSPATTRQLHEDHTVAAHVWHCAPGNDPARGHFMTGMNTTGYVQVAFTPGADGVATVFPATADRICWDQNLTNLGGRKWVQLAVISDDRYRAIGGNLIIVNPDNAANAGNSPVAAGDDFVYSGQFNGAFFFQGAATTMTRYDNVNITITDKATRYRTCITDNGDGTVTRSQVRPGGITVYDTGNGSFPAGPRVFILSDDSYNPDKFDVDKPTESPQFFGIPDPYTWHWDNLTIES